MSNEMIRELNASEIDMVSGAWSLGGGFNLGGGYSSAVTTSIATDMDFSDFTGEFGVVLETNLIGDLLNTIGGAIGGLFSGFSIDLGLGL